MLSPACIGSASFNDSSPAIPAGKVTFINIVELFLHFWDGGGPRIFFQSPGCALVEHLCSWPVRVACWYDGQILMNPVTDALEDPVSVSDFRG